MHLHLPRGSFLILLGIVIVLPGCLHKPIQDSMPVVEAQNNRPFHYEAKLIDVPFPLGTHLYDSESASDDQFILFFETAESCDVMTHYYKNELIHLGWDHAITYVGKSVRLVAFEKPYKWLHIHMTEMPHSQTRKITLFLAHKEYI
jgi:hypothetical protein